LHLFPRGERRGKVEKGGGSLGDLVTWVNTALGLLIEFLRLLPALLEELSVSGNQFGLQLGVSRTLGLLDSNDYLSQLVVKLLEGLGTGIWVCIQ
jgi:hypothetical protein